MDGDDLAHGEQNVNRLTLRLVLLTGLEDVVGFNKRLARYEENPDGSPMTGAGSSGRNS